MQNIELVQRLIYLLSLPILFLIAILPFRLLYLFSDFTFFLVYYIIGYRKKTVKANLKLVFPEKSSKEIQIIQKKFYKHMCDMFLEMIKTWQASKKQLDKRFIIKNPEVFKKLESNDKSVIVMYGHYASYEWSLVTENYINFKGYGVYKPLKNKYFDKLIRDIRGSYNTTLIPTKKTIDFFTEQTKLGNKYMIAFLSDQSPKLNRAFYWTDFMGIKVPCFTGADFLAKKLDLSVVYLKIDKVKRGFYEAEVVELTADANSLGEFEVTEKFTRILEGQIKEKPEYYLWTHKRWKHKDKAPKV